MPGLDARRVSHANGRLGNWRLGRLPHHYVSALRSVLLCLQVSNERGEVIYYLSLSNETGEVMLLVIKQ
jgi:hypothetical protein